MEYLSSDFNEFYACITLAIGDWRLRLR